jgi:RNA polymerase sigma-70 factor (ECF subfamily)
MQVTDKELKAKMKKSPAEARRALFDEYCNYVYAIVINKLRNCCSREDVEECVSDVFLDFFRSIDNIGKRNEELKGFIGVIAKRRAIDTYRRISKGMGRTVSIDDDDFDEVASQENVEREAEKSERNELLLKKVHELGEPDSTIIIQQYYYNRTTLEIGKAISMTAAAVQKRSVRARKRLRSMLTEIGVSI